MAVTKDELGSPGYAEKLKARWGSLPRSMIVAEYHGTGDPFFGGRADDRVLGPCGAILPPGGGKAAVFATIEDAEVAAKAIPNRRPGSTLGVVPTWR